jgi:hypothetical protein
VVFFLLMATDKITVEEAFILLNSLKSPSLPSHIRTQNFTNAELNSLISSFGGGNVMSDPSQMCQLAEHFYGRPDYTSWESVIDDPNNLQMINDGLKNFLRILWNLIAHKKRLPYAPPARYFN